MIGERRYLVVDSHQTPLAHAVLESAPDAPDWQIRVLDGDMDKVLEHKTIQLISMSEEMPSLLGRITLHRGERLVLERQGDLGCGARENLRIPARFDSFIYPLTGGWNGRRPVVGNDISCGGAAFFCAEPLTLGERMELVIPVTSEPLILPVEVLRKPLADVYETLYAAKFLDMNHDQETMLREAVFAIQIYNKNVQRGTVRS